MATPPVDPRVAASAASIFSAINGASADQVPTLAPRDAEGDKRPRVAVGPKPFSGPVQTLSELLAERALPPTHMRSPPPQVKPQPSQPPQPSLQQPPQPPPQPQPAPAHEQQPPQQEQQQQQQQRAVEFPAGVEAAMATAMGTQSADGSGIDVSRSLDPFSKSVTTAERLRIWDESCEMFLVNVFKALDRASGVRNLQSCNDYGINMAISKDVTTERLERFIFQLAQRAVEIHFCCMIAVSNVQRLQETFYCGHAPHVSKEFTAALDAFGGVASKFKADLGELANCVAFVQTAGAASFPGRDSALMGHLMRIGSALMMIKMQLGSFRNVVTLHARNVRAELKRCMLE